MKKRFFLLAAAIALLAVGCAAQPIDPVSLSPAGEDILLDPAALRPESGVWSLGDASVTFGRYDGVPLRWRVLASTDTQSGTEDSLLLDCGSVLVQKAYDDDFRRNDGQTGQPHEWPGSDLELWLNGDDFLGSAFTEPERAAIAATSLTEENEPYSAGDWIDKYRDFASKDQAFMLSAREARDLYADNAARFKDGVCTSWWLRSAFDLGGNGAASVHGDGHICNYSITNFSVGVSPAVCIKTSSVLFASRSGEGWKLTLLDPGRTVAVPRGRRVTRENVGGKTVITVPYAYGRETASRLGLLVTARDQVLYHGTAETAPEKKAGRATFILPAELADLTCGTDYQVYIFALDSGAADCAGPFCEITVPGAKE